MRFNPKRYLKRNKNPTNVVDVSEEDFDEVPETSKLVFNKENKQNGIHYKISVRKESSENL
jgi:hypothetical protein